VHPLANTALRLCYIDFSSGNEKKEIIACTHVMSCLNKKIFFFHHDNDDPLQKGNRIRQKNVVTASASIFVFFPSSYDFFSVIIFLS